MTNSTSNNQNVLQQISSSDLSSIDSKNKNVLVKSNKIRNRVLQIFVWKLKEEGKSSDEILNTILEIDKLVENGSINQDIFIELNKSKNG